MRWMTRHFVPSLVGGILACFFVVQSLAAEAVEPQRQQELLHLLKHDCGSCHGLTLQGGLGPALTPEALAGKPREALLAAILNGRAGTPMPPWSPMLSHQEAEWLVDELYRGPKRAE